MTYQLSNNEQRFIERMTTGDQEQKWGFELLLKKKENYFEYFDALRDAGLFEPAKNPPPTEPDEEGRYTIPPWVALDYLSAIAEKVRELDDQELATNLLEVIKTVTEHGTQDNHYTFKSFAEMLSIIPSKYYSKDYLAIVNNWLDKKYADRMASIAIGKKLLPTLINSDSEEDHDKALYVLEKLLTIRWEEKPGFSFEGEEPKVRKEASTIVDDYWINDIINEVFGGFCDKLAKRTVDLFASLIRENFVEDKFDELSLSLRPAIEDHDQNKHRNKVAKILIEGFRNSATAYVQGLENDVAIDFVSKLLDSPQTIFQRIGIYLVDTNWEKLSSLHSKIVDMDLYHADLHHETYHFLQKHFRDFEAENQKKVLEKIELTEGKENFELYAEYQMREKYAVLLNHGVEEVEKRYVELNQIEGLGSPREHPDFLTYISSGWVTPSSPYKSEEILDALGKEELQNLLKSFIETGEWKKPTKEGLVELIQALVKENPKDFLVGIPQFHDVDYEYQYALLRGFMELRRAPDKGLEKLNWDDAWPKIFVFSKMIFDRNGFWEDESEDAEAKGYHVNKGWIPPVVADLIESATQKDEFAASPVNLPDMKSLCEEMLNHLEVQEEFQEDAVNYAINHSRGKAIEALINLALRSCRLSSQEGITETHEEAWAEFEPLFQVELDKCQNTNFEFSTFVGNYLPQMGFLSQTWLDENLGKIFSTEYPQNFASAVNGLVYAPATGYVHKQLSKVDLFNTVVSTTIVEGTTRERFLQRIALQYIWGDEAIDGGLFEKIFHSDHLEDLISIIDFYVEIRRQDLDAKVIERIYEFRFKVISFIDDRLANDPDKQELVLSKLVRTCDYVQELTEDEYRFMTRIIPFAERDYNGYLIPEVLMHFVENEPQKVADLLILLLGKEKKIYDYQDNVKTITEKLLALGFNEEVRKISDIMEYPELWKKAADA